MTKAKRDKELLNFTIIRFSDIDLDGLVFFFVTGPQMVSHFVYLKWIVKFLPLYFCLLWNTPALLWSDLNMIQYNTKQTHWLVESRRMV